MWITYYTWKDILNTYSIKHFLFTSPGELKYENHNYFVDKTLSWWNMARRLLLLCISYTHMNFALPENHCLSGLCPSSVILKFRKHNILETGSVFIFRWGKGDIFCWIPGQPMWLRLTFSKGPTMAGVSISIPEDRNRSDFWNIVFSSF
jgi:hypothetical protein